MALKTITYQRVESVFNEIKDFPYGIVTSKGKVLFDSDDYSDMINITPKEFLLKYRAGTCLDTVEYQYYMLKDLKPKKIYFETEAGEAHVVVAIVDHDMKKWLVPEASFKKYLGIREFNTFNNILEFVEDIQCRHFHRKHCSIIDYTNVKMKYHIGYEEYWELMWTKGKILKSVKKEYDINDPRQKRNYII